MELTAKDLMVMDLVFSLETQAIQQITSISEENVTLNCITFDYSSYNEIKPIQLTTVLLEKCGFKRSKWDNYNTLRKSFNNNELSIVFNGFGICEIGDNLELIINYLHELQQLVRILAKQELDVSKLIENAT